VQVERLARHLPGPVEVLCGEVERISATPPMAQSRPAYDSPRVVQVPWGRAARLRRTVHARVFRGRLDVPDRYRPWASDAGHMLRNRVWRPEDVLVTFGQPWSDHLAGLATARRTHVPWIAHFSDPWVRNPLGSVHRAVRRLNAHLERTVVATADRVVFTNDDALELVMAPYPASWRAKARVVPHCFEPRAHESRQRDVGRPLIARHLGAFYADRSPRPLLRALGRLSSDRPDALRGLQVELVGPAQAPLDALPEMAALPAGLVRTRPPVDFGTSLTLMSESDLLLVVDAPAARSPFLPSKLIEYLGSGRPIAALSPPGPSADLVRRLGGWVADPANDANAAAALAGALEFAHDAPPGPWGDSDVRAEYCADHVAAAFEAVIEEVGAKPRAAAVART
jgi:hypothetical protein